MLLLCWAGVEEDGLTLTQHWFDVLCLFNYTYKSLLTSPPPHDRNLIQEILLSQQLLYLFTTAEVDIDGYILIMIFLLLGIVENETYICWLPSQLFKPFALDFAWNLYLICIE